jgi:hypothetical protein
MNADVLSTKVTEGIAVITLGSAKRMYFDAEMGDALIESLQEFAGDPNIRVVIVTGGTPGYFNRHFSIPALIEFAEAVRASGRQWPDNAAYHGGFFDKATESENLTGATTKDFTRARAREKNVCALKVFERIWRPRRNLNPCYRRERTTTIRKYNDLQEAGRHLGPC